MIAIGDALVGLLGSPGQTSAHAFGERLENCCRRSIKKRSNFDQETIKPRSAPPPACRERGEAEGEEGGRWKRQRPDTARFAARESRREVEMSQQVTD